MFLYPACIVFNKVDFSAPQSQKTPIFRSILPRDVAKVSRQDARERAGARVITRAKRGILGDAAPGRFSGFSRLGAVFHPKGESPPLAAAKSIFCETASGLRCARKKRLYLAKPENRPASGSGARGGATPAAQAACARPRRGPRTAPACGPEPAAAMAAPRCGSEPEGKRRNRPRSHRGFITAGLPVKATQNFFPVKSISGKNFRGPGLDRRRRLVRRGNQAVIGNHRPFRAIPTVGAKRKGLRTCYITQLRKSTKWLNLGKNTGLLRTKATKKECRFRHSAY